MNIAGVTRQQISLQHIKCEVFATFLKKTDDLFNSLWELQFYKDRELTLNCIRESNLSYPATLLLNKKKFFHRMV